MRVAFVLSSLWLSGGVRVVVEYANRLAARGHQVTLVAPRGTLDPDMVRELDRKVDLRESRLGRKDRATPLDQLRLSWSLARAVPPCDLVVTTHTPTAVATLIASRLLGRGRLVWLYQDYREMFEGRAVEDWLLRHALAWHCRALVVSEDSRRELLGFSKGDVVVVGEGLSHAESFHPLDRRDRRGDDRTRTLLFLGDMRPRKGLADFLAAAALVQAREPALRLVIVSKDDCRIETPVPHEFVHRPSRARLARLYADCDVFVSASWWESFGLPPLEAMACGACVVTTNSRGVGEYARDGENCLITPPRDPRALGDAILRVLHDEVLASRLRAAGPPTAARFGWEAATDRFERALAEVLN